MSLSLSDLLKRMLEMNGSDLHITTNSPPQVRVHGHLVPLDLPQTQAKSLDQDKEPLAISVNVKGQVYLQETEIGVDELVPKLKAITEARGGADERIYVRGDRQVDYGTMMKVMGRLSAAGFRRVALVTEIEQGR